MSRSSPMFKTAWQCFSTKRTHFSTRMDTSLSQGNAVYVSMSLCFVCVCVHEAKRGGGSGFVCV